jgi:hypothetical protein
MNTRQMPENQVFVSARVCYGPTVRRKDLALVPLIELVNQYERFVGALVSSRSLVQFPALRLLRDWTISSRLDCALKWKATWVWSRQR